MRACRRCGVYGPPETGVCDGCGVDLREHAADLPRGRYRCAAVRVERTCGGCERRFPVDGLPADQVLRCPACGGTERIASGEWSQVLAGMHAAADLVGEDPEGFERSEFAIDQVNPFAAS